MGVSNPCFLNLAMALLTTSLEHPTTRAIPL